MPWCPVCKNEYKEGYTICADCNAELVEELTDEVETKRDPSTHTEDIVDALEYAADNEIVDFDEKELLAEMMADEEYVENIHKQENPGVFVKASDKAENYKSSAFALLFVGILGMLFLVLSYFKVIPIRLAPHMAVIGTAVMGLMFAIFIVIGVYSLKSSKKYSEMAEDEDNLTELINGFFESEVTKEAVDNVALCDDDTDMTEEIKFFKRNETIKNMISDKFGDLDDAYLSKMAESMYDKLFEENGDYIG